MADIQKRYLAFFGVLLVVLFLGLNVIFQVFGYAWRLDLTEGRIYTISDGSHRILQTTEEPVRLKFFYSDRLIAQVPSLRSYAGRVRDLLKEIAVQAPDNVHLQIIDPEPFSETEDEAMAMGIKGIPLPSGQNFYFGLVGENQIDGSAVIPFFAQDREKFVEYDVIKMIQGLSQLEKPKLALVTSLPLAVGEAGLQAAMAGRAQPYAIYAELQNSYDMQEIGDDLSELSQQDFDLLMLVHPVGLSVKALYQIDQYLLRGGRLIVMIDPGSEMQARAGMQAGLQHKMTELSSDLVPLLKAWGVNYNPERVVLDRQNAREVQVSADGRTMRYPLWINVTADDMTQDEPITANLQSITLGSAGSMMPIAEEQRNKENIYPQWHDLLTSSPYSDSLPLTKVQSFSLDKNMQELITPKGRYSLAVRLHGNFSTAFPDGPVKPVDGSQDNKDIDKAHLAISKQASSVVIIADSDLLDDRFWLQKSPIAGYGVAVPFADNGNFILNVVDYLTGSVDLLSVRGRVVYRRPFTYLEDIRQQAVSRYKAEETALSARIDDTRRRLETLHSQASPASRQFLNERQEQEVKEFTQQLLESRRNLREVQRSFNREIQSAEDMIRVFNIGIYPLLAGIGLWLMGRLIRKRSQRYWQSAIAS